MPKVIQPRRHDKELSVQEFWKIKNEAKQQKTVSAFHAYREHEVENRHRYQKPSEQAKAFNPLALNLRPRNEVTTNDLYLTRNEQDDTCVAEYLADVQYKLNPAIFEVKKWTMGRQSILYNLEKIYTLLWANLHLEQTWHLLQAVIRDSKGVNLNIWLQTGLKTLSSTAAESCATNFSKPFFKNLFDTICVLMQTYYEPIVQNLEPYFQEYSAELMKHQNKYIRKFSVQSFSYLLGNLSQEQYQSFLNYVIRKQSEGFFDSKLSLADLLLQRLKIVKGCLTTASMTQFLTQLQTLQAIFEEKLDNHFITIASEFIGLLLDSLNCRQGIQDTQLLFDFIYVVKALIAFKGKHTAEKYGPILVRGFSNFLASYNSDKKKFTAHTPVQGYYLKQVFQLFGQFFIQNVRHFEQREELSQAVATLSIKCTSNFIYSSQIIAYCKQHQFVTKTVLKFVYEHTEPLDAGVMEVLLLLSREILRRFITEDQQMVNVYLIIVLIKRFGLQKLVQFSWFDLNGNDLCMKLQRAELEDDLIVILRLLAHIRIPQSSRQSIISSMSLVYSKHMTAYEQHINSLSLREVPAKLSGYGFFDCANFTREIILYAHHEIGWLSHIFNIYESFTLLEQHLQVSLQASSSVWDHLIISRPSALAMLSAKGRLQESSANNFLLINLLSSRNREVRHSSLEIIVNQFSHPFSTQLLNWLLDIDSSPIDLENEREVKRTFCNIEQHIQNMSEQLKQEAEIGNLYQMLLKWCLGFAFTGFKLIETTFISFLKALLEADMHLSAPQNMATILMPFLHHYNYRHSRQYEYDVSEEAPVSHLINAFPIATNQAIRALVSEDLQVTALETVEWIGLERVAEAVRTSKKCKKHLAPHLSALMEAYFQVQFRRQSKTIQSLELSPPKAFLLGIKVRFLVIILKLCPGSFLPPSECLHFTRQIFFQIESVRNIKRNNWQGMWQRRGDGQAKKKNDIAEIASTTINLEHLSAEEQKMYVSYLWKDILESNRHKKRIIMDHLRNYLPTATPLLFKTLFNYLHLSAEEHIAVDEQTVNRIVGRLRMMNRKSLLNGMFIMKAMLIHLKQEVTLQGRFKVISLFILSLIQIVYTSAPTLNDNNNEEEAEQQAIQEQEEQQQEAGNYFEYKQHRKELQKLLQTLFSHHQLQVENITELLEFLFFNTKINLAKSARMSVPGLLHILKIVSAEKQYCEVLARALNGDIISMLTQMVRSDENNERPLRACFDIWMQVMTNLILTTEETKEEDRQLQTQIDGHLKEQSANILSALLSHINATNSHHEVISEKQKQQAKRKENESLSILRLIARLLELQQTPAEQQWQLYIWNELGKLGKIKKSMTAIHCQKLSLLIRVLSRYIRLSGSTASTSNFLKKIISVMPSIKDPEQRLQILQLMIDNYSDLGLKEELVTLVSRMGELKKTGLVVGMDYPAFFEATNEYTAKCASFNLIDHEYFLFNLLCYADHEELSVRRAVSNCCRAFLSIFEQKIGGEVTQMQEQVTPLMGREGIELALKLYRAFLDMLSKQNIQKNEQVFWNIVDNIELFFTWFANHSLYISTTLSTSNVILYAELVPCGSNEEEKSYLKLMASISEASKLKGLKLIRNTLQGVASESRQAIVEWSNQVETAFPNPISKILLPITEYLILKPTHHAEGGVKSNLSSTFAKQAMEMLPLLAGLLSETAVKRQLKRLVSKLRFSETENKRNIAVIRMLGGLIDGVAGEKISERLHSYLEEHGFEQFHQKITQFSKTASSQAELDQSDDSEDEKERVTKKERIPGFFDRLEQLQSEQAINRNFLQFDRKIMQLQIQEEGEEEGMFPSFLKKHLLLPLRTMLIKESRGKGEQQNTKSQVLLSVTITKVLLRLPLDLFLREFQKVISRLGRLLKNRESEVRENARTCLCEIARSVGPQLLYAIIIELKFHLRDNFDRHVLNFSIFKVLQALPLQGGAIDYCLPLVLPSVIDEIFGQSSGEKEMVERHQVKTLKVEAKKQKGLQILQIVCRAISADRIAYIIDFLQKYLRDHLVTEVSLGKYDHMLGAINAGLAHNASALDTKNTTILLPILAQPVSKLREQIRQLNWQENATHENTVKKQWKRAKAGKEHILMLQEEAGRNKSIFKKMSKEIGERRNQEIIASSLIQFYLSLLSFFLKRQVFTLQSVTHNQQISTNFLTLLGFLGECVDQRDNRLVTKSLKTLHIALGWSTGELKGELQSFGEKFKSIRKQTSRKILLLVQQLTLADEDLLRQCFVFLNDLVSEAAVTIEMLPNFVSVIKLHTPTTQDQPHLPETYQLLRTLLFKCPQYLYHPLLDDLRQFVRQQLPTCRNKQLRDLASSILAVYLRPKSVLQPSVHAYNQSQAKNQRVQIDYSRRLQEQLTFYLSNLECPGQEGVLHLLQEFVNNREPQELQTYAELLLLGLITARTNQVGRQREHPADSLIVRVLKGINAGKVGGLIEKALLWVSQSRGSSIRLCGASFLIIILKHANIKLTHNFIDKYVLGTGGMLKRATLILFEEAESLQESRREEQGTKRLDSQWNDILNDIDVQERKYESDPSVIQFLFLINHLLSETTLANTHSKNLSQLVMHCWQLLHSKETTLVQANIACLLKISILAALSLKNEALLDPKDSFSIKKVVSSLIFNRIKAESVETLLVAIVSEEKRKGGEQRILGSLSWLLVGLALKAHIKPNIYQAVLPTILHLLLHVSLHKLSEELDFKSAIFTEPNFQEKLLQLSVKLTSNPLITFESKTLAEQVTEVLKDVMGVAEYFRAVGEYEVNKRNKKEKEKVKLAEMAILNPTQYIEEKRGRKKQK